MTLKLYIASILGISRTYDDKEQPRSLYVHVPFRVEARDIGRASDEACTEARKWFPREEGFYEVDVSIKPISAEYYKRLSQFAKLERLATTPGPWEQPVVFCCDTSDPDEAEGIVSELDQPPS